MNTVIAAIRLSPGLLRMTKMFNDPSAFAAETLAGFVRAFPTLVEQVQGRE